MLPECLVSVLTTQTMPRMWLEATSPASPFLLGLEAAHSSSRKGFEKTSELTMPSLITA